MIKIPNAYSDLLSETDFKMVSLSLLLRSNFLYLVQFSRTSGLAKGWSYSAHFTLTPRELPKLMSLSKTQE
jgi:hypothetical protein